ncbi:MAG TPA: chromosomal replication initiator protein DnaA [Solirubrobacteraceae bacterium]|nr:chromosomal replication initiator protein DnaA [Solirubrobacteraceae bacterium]
MSAELEHIWSRVQRELALSVDELTYRIWLAPLKPCELRGTRLLIEAPPQARGWLCDRFGRLLDASVANVLGPGATVELARPSLDVEHGRSGGGRAQRSGARREATTTLSQRHSRPPAVEARSVAREPLANPKLTFDQFVIGDCNRLAHAASLTVAELPAHAYNPLFICGPPGVGKTHLLSSIATLVQTHNPGLTVRCATGESFTNAFLESLAGGSTESFKARFRDVDVLLLDDVQFLERKTKTEEEFFHTFNTLHDGGRQIVLTSDRRPRDLQALEDRLRERFSAGLVADVEPPDLATRLAILHKRAHHDGIQADDDAIRAIAERIADNVRSLEGALIRVVAFSSLTGRPIDVELAHEVLDTLYQRGASTRRSRPTASEIQSAVSEHFGLRPHDLLSTSRAARVAWPRQLAMYLARELTDGSLPAIGRDFGGRDHTTVLHACRRASARLADDGDARNAVEKLCRSLGVGHPRRPSRSA